MGNVFFWLRISVVCLLFSSLLQFLTFLLLLFLFLPISISFIITAIFLFVIPQNCNHRLLVCSILFSASRFYYRLQVFGWSSSEGGFFHRGGALAGSGRAESRFHCVSIYLLRSSPCLLPRFILFPMVPFLLSFNQHFSGPSSLHPHDILRFHRFVCLWKQSLAYFRLLHGLCCLTTLCSEI